MAGDRPGPQCTVCEHPARSAADHWFRAGEKSQNQIAADLGVTRFAVNRHVKNCLDKVPTALALSGDKQAQKLVQQSARDLANSQRELVELIDDIVDKARWFLDKFGDSDNSRDIKAALDTAIAAARLLGDKQGAFPKASAQTVDARSIHLNGLSQDDLKMLIAGLKDFSGSQHPL